MTKILCVYHANCLDGFAAAWALKQAFENYPTVQFYAGIYGEQPPSCENSDVFLVDFSYKREIISQMLRDALSVTVIDHHKTAIEDLESLAHPNFKKIFEINHSGAVLTWNHFFNEPAPVLLQHIEDRDLWRFNLPYTREICSALSSYEMDFDIWDSLVKKPINSLIAEGMTLDRAHLKTINHYIKTAKQLWTISGFEVPVLNCPPQWASDAGNIMSADFPFAATYWENKDGQRIFSLRSAEYGVDVSEIAKQFGGGGHKNASGFKTSIRSCVL